MHDLNFITLPLAASIREAMRNLSENSLRIAVVCDDQQHLLGTVTDGDIRRGLLHDFDLHDPVTKVMNQQPVTAKETDSRQARLKKMQQYDLLALPIVNDSNELVGIETLKQAMQPPKKDNPVFIMAGGFGTRLQPLTDYCPKPMLRIGEKPMLEHLIEQFISFGYQNFYISTHYLPQVIQSYFGDGSKWKIKISYIHEETPLGTGGALTLLPKDLPDLPLIMMNGDVLTKVDFDLLLSHHEKNQLDATMCVRELENRIPFGVIKSEQGLITSMVEKPNYRYHINTGIYVLSPEFISSVKTSGPIDMPTLLEQRIAENNKIGIFTSYDYWLDIGRMSDYQKAQQDIERLFK